MRFEGCFKQGSRAAVADYNHCLSLVDMALGKAHCIFQRCFINKKALADAAENVADSVGNRFAWGDEQNVFPADMNHGRLHLQIVSFWYMVYQVKHKWNRKMQHHHSEPAGILGLAEGKTIFICCNIL